MELEGGHGLGMPGQPSPLPRPWKKTPDWT